MDFKTLLVVSAFMVSAAVTKEFPEPHIKNCADGDRGDYSVFVGRSQDKQLATLYCQRGKEYLSLPHENVFVYKNERGMKNHGTSTFKKIRINAETLVVDMGDLTFSRSTGNYEVNYGFAGGCRGPGLTSGGFKIDLTGTPFAIDDSTEWISNGWFPKMDIKYTNDRQKVIVRCGGKCGFCRPKDHIIRLNLITDKDPNPESRLLKDLFTDYDERVRPVASPTDNVTVAFRLHLQQIADYDARMRALSLDVWLDLTWTDMNLKWNPDDYGGIEKIQVSPKLIWKPDIRPYNSAHAVKNGGFIDQSGKVVIDSSGSVSWIPTALLVTICNPSTNTTSQTCKMKFGSWVYDAGLVDPQLSVFQSNSAMSLSEYVRKDKRFTVIGNTAKRNSVKYDCCLNQYVDLTYKLTFKDNEA